MPVVRTASPTGTINRVARAVTRAGTVIPLPRREFALLKFLALRAGEVVSRTEIEAHLYNDDADLMSNAVDAAVYSSRRRIQPTGTLPHDAPERFARATRTRISTQAPVQR